MEQLTNAAIEEGMCATELLEAIKAQDKMLYLLASQTLTDAGIADNMKSFWTNQSSLADK